MYANGTCWSRGSYIRIPRFVVGASIESGSRHRLLFSAAPDPLLAADNFFSPFPPSTTRLSFRLNPLPLSSLPPLYHLPAASSTLPCQQLKDFFDKSSAHTSIPPPLACASPAIRFEEIDSSPVYDVLSNRVNTERPSSSLKLDVSPHCAHLYCFPHVTCPAGIVPARKQSRSALPGRTPRAASFGTKDLWIIGDTLRRGPPLFGRRKRRREKKKMSKRRSTRERQVARRNQP